MLDASHKIAAFNEKLSL